VIGRDRELQLLAAAWDEARLGRGRLVEIRAEPGMGKSRLLSAFIESCPDVVTIRTECRLYQSATPYYPFKSLLRRSLGLDSLTDAEAAVRLDEIVRTKAPHLLPWLSLIGVPMGIDLEGSEESDRLDDKYRRRRLEESVDALLSVVLVEPAILAIEDAHWMDEASLDLLRKLTSDLGRRPWLVCLTRQGDAGGDLDGQRGALTIDLQPLEASHAAELIIAATESAPLMPDTVAELARRAAGNPLFLIELLEALGRGEDLDYLPDSVEEMIGARIDRLPPSDRQLLRRVAVLGVGFRADHLAAVADPAESDLGRVLDRLSGFITRDATGWVQFRHALLRDVAYRGLPYRLRRQLHCSVADSIRAMGKSASETRAELLSVHYFEAGNWGQAWTYSRLAGDQAKAIYANQDAAKFYLRALRSAQYCEEIPPPELAAAWEALGDVRELGGVYDGALTAFLRASRLIRTDPLAQANLALKRARARMRVGAYQLALAETTKGRRLAERVTSTDGMKARARLLSFRSMLRMAQERPREALALAEQAVLEAESAGEEEALARAYSTMDWSYYMLGEPHKATHLTQALAIYQRLGQVERAADVMNNIGAFAYLDGDWARAVEWFSKSRDAFKQAGDESGAALVGANIGEVLVGQGRLAEAEPILVESVRVLRASHGRDDAIAAEIALARLHLEERDYEEATRLLEQLRREALELGQIVHALEVALYLADCVTRAGDPEAALALLEQASAEAGGEAAMLASTMARVRAEALVELGRLDEAGAEIAIGLSQARQQGLLYEEALLLRARIDLASRSGQDADPTESARAMELLARLGVRQASAARFIPS
jgi:tetratricopeptide (TPR) repeat protein